MRGEGASGIVGGTARARPRGRARPRPDPSARAGRRGGATQPEAPDPRVQDAAPRAARLVAVGGGKGGVGKTFLTANVATLLARGGWRVVAVDTDIEGANLHTWLGVPSPRRSLADYVAGRARDPAELLVETGVPGLRLLAATHGHLAGAQPEAERRTQLLRGLRALDADFVFVDCGAGAHPATIDYFLVGDDGVLVLHPEPTSVENTYAFLRAAFYRRMEIALQKHDVRACVQQAMDQRNERGIRTPLDLLREVHAMDPEEGHRFVATMRAFRPRLVVNEVESAEDVKLGFQVRSVCRKFFGLEVEYTGYVNRDDGVREAILRRRPVVDAKPGSDASIYLQRIARKLLESAEDRA